MTPQGGVSKNGNTVFGPVEYWMDGLAGLP
jgi:hypothetical protein